MHFVYTVYCSNCSERNTCTTAVTKYEIVYFKNMIKNKWQKNDNNQNKVNMFMLIRRLQNSNN